jgi:hypothetical protein
LFGGYSNLSSYADKYLVREYVKQKIGDQYLIPLIDCYDNVEDIPFHQLPDQFVLKATHGSGWNYICTNKDTLDIQKVKKLFKKWLSRNYYWYGRELIYKNIVPRIVCESYIQNSKYKTIPDFKFYCFHGKVHFAHIDAYRFIHMRRNLYTPDWQLLPFRLNFPSIKEVIPPPKFIHQMIDIAESLGSNFPFVRVDLYETNDQVFFGELTFLPGSGYARFYPSEWDEKFGSFIDLNRLPQNP